MDQRPLLALLHKNTNTNTNDLLSDFHSVGDCASFFFTFIQIQMKYIINFSSVHFLAQTLQTHYGITTQQPWHIICHQKKLSYILKTKCLQEYDFSSGFKNATKKQLHVKSLKYLFGISCRGLFKQLCAAPLHNYNKCLFEQNTCV